MARRGLLRPVAVVVGVAVLMAVWAAPVAAAPEAPDPEEIERLRQQVSVLRHRLDETSGRVESLAEEARQLELAVELLEREGELLTAELARNEAMQGEIELRVERLMETRRQLHRRYSERLALLYRLGNGGVVRLLLAPEARERQAAARSMAYLARRDLRLLREIDELARRLKQERMERAALVAAASRLAADAAAKQAALEETRRSRERVLDILKREQRQDRRRLAELEERAQRLERLVELLQKRGAGSETAEEDPRRYRGSLVWPLEGVPVTRFGRQRHPRFDVYVMNKGVELAAEPGTPVSAVFPGRVRYARWLKGYGNLVIVDHGNQILSLYGHLAGIVVDEGRRVTIGDEVGSVAVSSHPEEPALYFEIREGGEAVDPMAWLGPKPGTR